MPNITVKRITRNIKVAVQNRNIVVKRPIRNIQVNQVGRRGPQGLPGLIQAIVAGTNITVDNTDPKNPVISSEGGGADLAIGEAVTGSEPNRFLLSDDSGNLTDSPYRQTHVELFGGLVAGDMLTSVDNGGVEFGFVDASAVGGGMLSGWFGQSTDSYGVTITDIDTLNSYLTLGKTGASQFVMSIYNEGVQVDPYPTFVVYNGFMTLNNTQPISGFSNDTALADASENDLVTEYAVKTYVDDEISNIDALPDQTGNSGKFLSTDGTDAFWDTVAGGGSPGGSDTQVQFNNSGAFGGSSDFTWDNSSKLLDVNGRLDLNLVSPTTNVLDVKTNGSSNLYVDEFGRTNISSDSAEGTGTLSVRSLSSYTSGSTQKIASFSVQIGDSPASGFVALDGEAKTGGGTANAQSLTGFNGSVVAQHSTGTIGSANGATVRINKSGAGDLTNASAFRIFSTLKSGAGSLSNNYGLRIDDQTVGTNNYAILTGLGRHKFGGSFEYKAQIVSANTTLGVDHHIVEVDTAVTITLPSAGSAVRGREYVLINTSAGSVSVTSSAIIGNLGSATTDTILTGESRTYVANGGGKWRVI